MNRLCWNIEKWEKQKRWKRKYDDFDYKIMIDNDVNFSEKQFLEVELIYKEFCKKVNALKKEESEGKKSNPNFRVNLNYHYDKFRKRCEDICPDKKALANIAVILCYEKYPNRNKKFIWRVAREGILSNIEQQEIYLPTHDENGSLEYLGNRYTMKKHDNTMEVEAI